MAVDRGMRKDPNDVELLRFVARQRIEARTDEEIAGALNRSAWRRSNGVKRWRAGEVAAVCVAPLNIDEPGTVEADACCALHRRVAVLNAIQAWRPFDADAGAIALSYVWAGHSLRAAVGRLNREKVPAPGAGRWTPTLVRAAVYLSGLRVASDEWYDGAQAA